jgi:hypothetical protein
MRSKEPHLLPSGSIDPEHTERLDPTPPKHGHDLLYASSDLV